MTISLSIRCDGCDRDGVTARGPSATPAHRLRRELRAAGWRTVRIDGPADYCPECVAAGKHRGERPVGFGRWR
jgi:hypothetical protein